MSLVGKVPPSSRANAVQFHQVYWRYWTRVGPALGKCKKCLILLALPRGLEPLFSP